MIYLMTVANVDSLEGAVVTRLDGTEVPFTITDTKHWAYFIEVEGSEFKVRPYAIVSAYQGGTKLRLDTTSTKIRQMTNEKIAEMTSIKTRDVDNNEEELTEIDLDIIPTYLKDITWDPKMFEPNLTGTFLDKFVSTKGGWLPATNIMVTGDPGIGKSSNMIETLVRVKATNPNKTVAYISAEMEAEDFEEFKQFYPGLDEIPILFLGEYLHEDKYPIWQVVSSFLNTGYDLVVLDSMIEIQMMIQEELSLPQKKGEAHMLKLMRRHNKGFNKSNSYTCFLCIQQKNKSGQYVGSKRLEHMTTAFLQFLWDPKEKGKRYMIFEKNRKGSVKNRLYYSFAPTGIEYDEKRYAQEKELFELTGITGKDADEIAELGLAEFEAMFKAPKKDITD